MTGPINADSWMDVAAYAIVGVPALVASLGALRVAKKNAVAQRAVAADVTEVKDHVANTHSTNLRADLDGKADKDDVAEVSAKVDDLAEELRGYIKEDRAVRRDLVRRIQTQERIADQHHPGER
ncbi:DUF2746 domain-containing protein [Tsukamurella sp. NPDC003166]|uniref:DUF2746 domain-containing protein n=1 Tax=Tsukamurella sp. NPDC003166 TaxID=3154444 RepID=UPI0033A47F7D